MAIIFHYPNCNTCKKAIKWLEEKSIDVEKVHIVEHTPSAEEIAEYHVKSGLPLKRFFNTSGKVYRELDLKSKASSMSDQEIYALLAENGMLIKRPIYVDDTRVLVGFKELEWEVLI